MNVKEEEGSKGSTQLTLIVPNDTRDALEALSQHEGLSGAEEAASLVLQRTAPLGSEEFEGATLTYKFANGGSMEVDVKDVLNPKKFSKTILPVLANQQKPQ